eukprot:12912280-Prorocentrum_lima.AAC.1
MGLPAPSIGTSVKYLPYFSRICVFNNALMQHFSRVVNLRLILVRAISCILVKSIMVIALVPVSVAGTSAVKVTIVL